MFYVYLHRRASDNSVFYVGKGKLNRAYSQHSRSIYWKRIVAKHGYTVEIVQDHLQEWYAFELEKDLIAYYGRENLCNLTDGGEGASNPSNETIKKMKFAKIGKPHSSETKAKRALALTGHIVTNETKAKISASTKGRKHTESAKKAMSASRMGKKPTAQALENHRLAMSKIAHEVNQKRIERLPRGTSHYRATLVQCNENKMTFGTLTIAVHWLKENGYPKAVNSNLSTHLNGKAKTAYGHTWSKINNLPSPH